MINDSIFKYFTVKNVIVFIVLFLLCLFAVTNKDIALMFFASIVISCSLTPLVDKMEQKMSRQLASAIVLGSFILLLCIFMLPMLAIGTYQIVSFADTFPQYIDNIDNLLKTSPFLQSIGINKETLNIDWTNAATHAGELLNNVVVFLKGLSSALVYILITIIFTYFFMSDTNTVKTTFLRFFPTSIRGRAEEVVDIIARKMGGYIIAQAYAITSVGIVMTVGLLLFRVDYAILLGLITAILDIIPVAGPAVALIVCLVASYEGGMLPIVGVLVSFVAAQLIENNLVRPYAFSKLLNIHPLMIFLFLFIAAKYLGVVGALFAPALAAMVCVLVEELYMKYIE
ncbi:MAG: AI-2E family transporter [bacterium]|nr:AI-2E family transporter [bacterium]